MLAWLLGYGMGSVEIVMCWGSALPGMTPWWLQTGRIHTAVLVERATPGRVGSFRVFWPSLLYLSAGRHYL